MFADVFMHYRNDIKFQLNFQYKSATQISGASKQKLYKTVISMQESNTFLQSQTYCIALQPEKLMIYSDWRALALTHKGITNLSRVTNFTKKTSVLFYLGCKCCRCFPRFFFRIFHILYFDATEMYLADLT